MIAAVAVAGLAAAASAGLVTTAIYLLSKIKGYNQIDLKGGKTMVATCIFIVSGIAVLEAGSWITMTLISRR